MTKSEPNWTAIAVPYRAGIVSVRAIAKAYDVTLSRLQKHAKKNGWIRDPAPRVRQATKERLVESELDDWPSDLDAPSDLGTDLAQSQGMSGLRDEERRVNSHVADDPCARARADDEIVEAVSRLQADVIGTHKRDILKAQALVNNMLTELAATSWGKVEAILREKYKDNRQRRDLAAALRAVDAPTRATTIRTLASALETLVKIERQAYAMDAEGGEEKATPLEERLEQYAREAAKADGIATGRVVELGA